MSKKVNWLANMRVDIPDLEQGTHGYTDELFHETNTRLLKAFDPAVVDGFRIEIPDQTSFPGQLTVHSGLAIRQDGDTLYNSEDIQASRSITFGADNTYYLEIELLEQESDAEPRGFWDPDYDNGTDSSGDVLPDGREFDDTVSTRVLQDWTIVSPSATSGFDITGTPSSSKVPLAVLVVSGGEITGITTFPARTTLRKAAGSSDTQVFVNNSLLFDDSGTITFDDNGSTFNKTIASNDRENGIITITATLGSNLDPGVRAYQAGGSPTQYLAERSDPNDSADDDQRQRFWQGNEDTGHSLSQDPYASSGNSDLEVKKLKEYVDFIAAQLREMKGGAALTNEVGDKAPPTSFSSDFRYFENSGGIQGARTNTVSVGDGSSTWGDFNSVQSGSAGAAIQAAIDAVASGGIIYLKAGTYTLTTTVTVNKSVRIVGEGVSETIVDASSSVSAFTLNDTGAIGLQDVAVTTTGTAAHGITITQCGAKSKFENCSIQGLTATACDQAKFEGCSFTGNTNGVETVTGVFTNCVFDHCTFDNAYTTSSGRALDLASGCTEIAFRSCKFSTSGTTPTAVTAFDETEAMKLRFDHCTFDPDAGGSATCLRMDGGGYVSSMSFTGCQFNGAVGGFLGAASVIPPSVGLVFDSCRMEVPTDAASVTLSGPGTTIKDCSFTQASSGSGTTGYGIRITGDIAGVDNVVIRGNNFINCDIGVWFDESNCNKVMISENVFQGTLTNRCRYGVLFTGSGVHYITNLRINNNEFYEFDDDSGAVTLVAGIYSEAASLGIFDTISIAGNTFTNIGKQSSTTLEDAYCILINDGSSTEDLTISNNVFKDLRADGQAVALFLGDSANVRTRICGNSFDNINNTAGNNLAGQAAVSIYIENWDHLVIANNVIEDVGYATATGGLDAFGIFLGKDAVGSYNRDLAITGNIIENIRHGTDTVGGIYVSLNGSEMVLSGNKIGTWGGSATSVGIIVIADGEVNEAMENVAITSNIIKGADYGIWVDLVSGSQTDEFETYTITGNVVDEFGIRGIYVEGDDVPIPMSITGNSVVSSTANTIGMYLDRVQVVSISGNTIKLVTVSGTTNEYGIHLYDCRNYSIVGNSIYMNTSLGAGVGIDVSHLDTNTRGTISANMVYSSGGNGSSIRAGDNTLVSANTLIGWGFGSAPVVSGTNCFATAPVTSLSGTVGGAGSSAGDPVTGTATVDLNYDS